MGYERLRKDLTKAKQALEPDVLNDNIRNGGVVHEEVVERADSFVLDGLRKMTDDELGDDGVVLEDISDAFQEFIDIDP